MNDITESLVKARELIVNGWSQGADARDGAGQRINLYSENAVSFCTVGALHRTTFSYPHLLDAQNFLKEIAGDKYLTVWNDHPARTKEEVIDLFDRAIRSSV